MTNDRNSGLLSELEKLTRALGTWSERLAVGGGVALIVYDQCIAHASASPVGTTDLDFLIPRNPGMGSAGKSVVDILEQAGFVRRLKDTGIPPIESYFKQLADTEVEVEFLTDDRARKRTSAVAIPRALVVAQALSYLEMSLQSTIAAQLPGGTMVRVVTPEAWTFHKGLTFVRRKPGSFKREKDLYGIWFVLTCLGTLSEQTWANLRELQARHPSKWTAQFQSNIRNWVERATPQDWQRLISQDPRQRLTEVTFRHLATRLASND